MRLLTRRSLVTCAALAKAAATVALSPYWKSAQTFCGTSSNTSGAPGWAAARASVTAGSASMSSTTASAASLASASVSATTKATGSPTNLTFSVASE